MRSFFIFFLVAISSNIQGQIAWQKFGVSPAMGRINCMDYDPVNSKLYVGTDNNGVFTSSDFGGSWSALSTGLPAGQSVSDFGITSAGGVFCVLNGIIYQFNSSSSTWSVAYNSGTYITNANLVEQDQSGNMLAFTKTQAYMASANTSSWVAASSGLGSVFGISTAKKGADGKFYMAWGSGIAQWNGSVWTQLSTTGLLQDKNNQIVSAALVMSDGTLYAGSSNGVLKNASGSWTSISAGLPTVPYSTSVTAPVKVNDLAINSAGDMFAVTQDISTTNWEGNVYKMSNGTSTWVKLGGLPQNIFRYTSILIISNSIYVLGSEGVYKSSDGGTSWVSVSSGIVVPAGIKSFDFLSDGRIIAGTNIGKVYLGDATGSNWSDITSKTFSCSIGHIRADANNTIFLSAGSAPAGVLPPPTAGLFYSKDFGGSWTRAFPSGRGSLQDISLTSSNEIYFGGAFDPQPDGHSIHYSTNGGSTWSIINVSAGAAGAIFSANKDNNGIYAGSELSGALRSTDNGQTFQSIGNTSGVSGNVPRLDFAPWGDLFVSYDYTRGMRVVPATQLSTTSPNATILTNFPSVSGVYYNPADIVFGNTNNIYVATDKGFFSSTDNGANFTGGTSGLAQSKISRLRVNKIDGYLYMANAEGLFKSTTQVISVGNCGTTPQTITFGVITGTHAYGDANIALSATGGASGNPVTFTSSDATIAKVVAVNSGYQVQILGAGSVNITAHQACNSQYSAATDVVQKLTIGKANQTISFGTIADKTEGLTTSFQLSATSDSKLAVQYSTTSTNISISNGQVSIIGPGRASIIASQVGDSNYNSAASVTQSFCVIAATPAITILNNNSTNVQLQSSSAVGNQWYLNSALISGATQQTLVVAGPGTYKVQIQVDDCVSSFSVDQVIVVTSVDDISTTLNLSPNPASDRIKIELGDEGKTKSVLIYNTTGGLVSTQLVTGRDTEIDLSDYPAGLFMVNVISDKIKKTIKFVKR